MLSPLGWWDRGLGREEAGTSFITVILGQLGGGRSSRQVCDSEICVHVCYRNAKNNPFSISQILHA